MTIGKRVAKFFLGNSTPGLWSWAFPGSWSKTDLLKQYTRQVYPIVSAIAEDAAKIEFEIERNEKPVTRHPFFDLIKMPNPDTSQFQFLEAHFTFMKLSGESFWYLAKGERTQKPKELYLLRPDLMEVAIDMSDPRGLVSGYVFNKLDGTKQTFDRNEVIHFKMPNPLNPYRGLGTVEAAKTYIETEQYASNWTKNSLYNSGRPAGILNIKGVITQEEFISIKKQFKDQYTGTENTGKTMMLKGADGIDYTKLGMEMGEVALKELKDMTRDDIMMMFRVSKTMLGISEGVTLNNARDSRGVFINNIIKPELDRFVDNLNAFLMPVWGEGYELCYEDPSLVNDAERLAEWTAGFNKWLTTNDIRQDRGLEPLEGGDVIREPVNLIPDNISIDSSQDTNTSSTTEKLKKKVKKKVKKKEITPREIYIDQFYKSQILWERKYMYLLMAEFRKQLKECLAGNSKGLYPEWEFDVVASKGRIMTTLVPFGTELMKESGKIAMGESNQEFQINQRVREYISNRVSKLADSTNDITIKQIDKTVTEGLMKGEDIGKIGERVKAVYKMTDARAEMIARTETLAAGNEGALEAYRQNPLVTRLEWVAEDGACDDCEELNGTEVDVGENFANSGEMLPTGAIVNYGDVDHPPLHPNCRCNILPVSD
jgi:HK97 family phage portal protein